ncbi:MAG: oligopeptide transporter, OPT family [Phycisphaerae bacterium]|nr:oligopeptide transporter, OPT family [Phycisphaerae bacterium]NIW72605.1 oligopeptide transporter, OPT family [candidate division KSB1 bacterium]NIP51675.1 oligopeptide transporter, OPT family [Phycisphaerae bacterium]NIS50844.1 oligopeptide transporter, OPT family [Phycisphaerae bacterium]NIU08563.1 oligopeptide transporter, OPT family [Phycisphaerae bacterium]
MSLQGRSLPEITIKAVVLGVLLSMILAAANAYLGLFAGMTVSASIPAAVVSMGILRWFRRSNILENNIVQTAASAGESLAAGVIFTLPALVILGEWDDFGGKNFVWITIIAAFGGLLGVLFTIPLRRSLIVEGKLKFPEGIATAEVLETGQEGGKGVRIIAKAALVGALFKVGAKGIGLWPEVLEGARGIKRTLLYGGSNLSPALLSVGYIVGLNIAVLIFLGGAANWYAAIPAIAGQNEWPVYQLESEIENPDAWNAFPVKYKAIDRSASATEIEEAEKYNADIKEKLGKRVDAKDYSWVIWSKRTRYIGVGAMLIGGLWTIFKMRKSIVSGIKSGLEAYRAIGQGGGEIERTEKDMSMKWVLMLIVASVVPLFMVYQYFVNNVTISLPMAVVMLIAGFVFSAVAGYMAGLVGSSNNPISGITIATILVSSLLLVVLMGKGAEKGPAAAIIIGSVVCCAAAIAGDNMQDLKAGRIVGATPWKQQVMQIVGTLSGAIVIAPVLMLLHQAYGFRGMKGASPDALAAVQANLMASVSQGVFKGDMPWKYAYIGMGVAAAIIALDLLLEAKKSSFPYAGFGCCHRFLPSSGAFGADFCRGNHPLDYPSFPQTAGDAS